MYSLSFCVNDKFSLKHDRREIVPKNAKPENSKNNVYYSSDADKMDVRAFYEKYYQKSYEEFIERTKKNHPERVKDWPPTYYEFILQKQQKGEEEKDILKRKEAHFKEIHQADKYTRTAKQMIVQFGKMEDFFNMTPEQQITERDKMMKGLKMYMDTFEEHNPGFKIIDAAIHCDEQSKGPHMHLTFAPVVECARGQKVQNSLNAAFKMQGLETDKDKNADGKWETAQMKWQTKEREYIMAIGRAFGIESTYQKGNRSQHKTVDEFKMFKDEQRIRELKELEEKNQVDKQEINEKQSGLAEQELQLQVDKHDLDAEKQEFQEFVSSTDIGSSYQLKKENEKLRTEIKESQSLTEYQRSKLADIWDEYKSANSDYFSTYKKNKTELKQLLDAQRKDIYSDKDRIRKLMADLEYKREFLLIKLVKLITAIILQVKNTIMEKRLEKMQMIHAELKAQAKAIVDESKSMSVALKSKDFDNISNAIRSWNSKLIDMNADASLLLFDDAEALAKQDAEYKAMQDEIKEEEKDREDDER